MKNRPGVGTKRAIYGDGCKEEAITMNMKKIVLVDDDETVRKTFTLLLEKKYRVVSLKDPRQALSQLKDGRADLVIADYKLPHFTGMELIKRLRENGYEGEAMLITAHPDDVRIQDMGRYAISHFFVKPLDLNDLNLSIDRVLQPKDPLAVPA
ncbi:MAG: response regulator [Marinilabiliales bacterium]|nr:response regulator [Marinilabiliales bacterium]